jgi:hypothetical protein
VLDISEPGPLITSLPQKLHTPITSSSTLGRVFTQARDGSVSANEEWEVVSAWELSRWCCRIVSFSLSSREKRASSIFFFSRSFASSAPGFSRELCAEGALLVDGVIRSMISRVVHRLLNKFNYINLITIYSPTS